MHIINNADGFVGRFTGGASSNVTAGIYANSTLGFASIGVQSAHQFRIFTSDADRLTVTSDGSIGIGTTSPQAQLHLVLTGASTRFRMEAGATYAALLDFYNATTARWSIGVDNSQTYGKLENRVLATDAIRFYDSTNNLVLVPSSGIVGIGIANPTNTKFYVNASGISQTVSAVEIAIAGSGTFQRGVRMLNGGMVSGESLLYMVGRNSAAKNTGQMYFYYDGDGSNNNRLSLGLYAVDDVFNINAAANIGIGTTSPTQKLHIVGTTGLPASSGTSQTGTLRLQLSGYGTVLDFGGEGPATGKQWIQATDASSLGYTYPLLLNPNGGSVGIGTTSPNYPLHVYKSSGISTINVGSISGQNSQYRMEEAGVVKFAITYVPSDSTTRMYFGGYGGDLITLKASNVGIGTTDPSGQLSGTIGLSIVNATNAALGLSNGTNNWLNYLSGTTYRIWNNSVSEVMTILLNGNIGIGTSSPAFKLDISSGSPDILRVINTGSASGNNPTAQFLNTYGNHSWGICAEFRVGANGGTDRPSILFSQAYDTNTWGIGFGYVDSTYFRINKDQGPYGGGWGTTLFSMDRSGNYSFAGSNVSDRRSKKNINYVVNPQLDTILKLKPASFVKKSPGKNEYGDFTHTGFIAQDVLEEGIPNLVHGNEEEGYALDYDGILALSIKAIQEQQIQIEELKGILNKHNIK